jgi:hypothetical protein
LLPGSAQAGVAKAVGIASKAANKNRFMSCS